MKKYIKPIATYIDITASELIASGTGCGYVTVQEGHSGYDGCMDVITGTKSSKNQA